MTSLFSRNLHFSIVLLLIVASVLLFAVSCGGGSDAGADDAVDAEAQVEGELPESEGDTSEEAAEVSEQSVPKAPVSMRLTPENVMASSVYPGEKAPDQYEAASAFDGMTATCWVEAADGPGLGESITLEVWEKIEIDALSVAPGYFVESFFKKNNRVKTLSVSFDGGDPIQLEFNDVMEVQGHTLDKVVGFTSAVFSISDVYKGDKWDDTCIAEISLFLNDRKYRFDVKAGAGQVARAPANLDISAERFEFQFDPPSEVRSELVSFKPLVPEIRISERSGATYVTVKSAKAVLYSEPSVSSSLVRKLEPGDSFWRDATQQLPDKFGDLDEEQRKALQEKYSYVSAEELERAYAEHKGVLHDGLYNIWYKVSSFDETGWVFGAYTAELNKWPRVTTIRELYKRGAAFKSYQDYEVEGYSLGSTFKPFPAGQKDVLEDEFLILESVSPDSYYLDTSQPDDMVALYKRLAANKLNPLLITTDFIMHALHVLFDRSLQDVEENDFLPFIGRLSVAMFDEVTYQLKGAIEMGIPSSIPIYSTLQAYFAIPLMLMNEIAPEIKGMQARDPMEFLNEEYAGIVQQELSLIKEAKSAVAKAPLLGDSDDYAQFTVRGHYTRTKALGVFFQVMMWYGRKPLPTRLALAASIMLESNTGLYAEFNRYFDAITSLIGETDDATVGQYLELLDSLGSPYLDELYDDDLIERFEKLAKEKLPQPRIRTPNVGFKFFGQRFTLDAFLFTMLSWNAVGTSENKRVAVKGWDIAASFGSEWAEEQLKPDRGYANFTTNLNTSKELVENQQPEDWLGTFYGGYLGSIRQLLLFPRSTGVPWFDSDRYMQKNHLTFFGAYTELKHDTILFTIQPYAAERGGDDDYFYLSFGEVTDPLPIARSYVEPNVPFYEYLLAVEEALDSNAAGEFLSKSSNGSAFKRLFEEVRFLRDVAKREAAFQSIDLEDYERMLILPTTIGQMLSGTYSDLSGVEDTDQFKMAVVSDIFTGPENALEIATGVPQKIRMTVFDPSGGRRVAIGYVYSYYEFWQPASDRLNDERWKEMVYEQKIDPAMEPDWIEQMRATR